MSGKVCIIHTGIKVNPWGQRVRMYGTSLYLAWNRKEFFCSTAIVPAYLDISCHVSERKCCTPGLSIIEKGV